MKASILKAIVEFRNFAGWESLQIDFSGSNKFPIFIIYDLWANSACTFLSEVSKKWRGRLCIQLFGPWTFLGNPFITWYQSGALHDENCFPWNLCVSFVLNTREWNSPGINLWRLLCLKAAVQQAANKVRKSLLEAGLHHTQPPPPERDLPPLSPHRHHPHRPQVPLICALRKSSEKFSRLGAVTVGSGLRSWYDKISNWCATDALGFWMILMLLTVTQEKGSQENMYCWAVISLYFLPFLTGLEVLLVLCIRGMRCRSFSLQ